MLYPFLFQPIFKERIWGGRSLEKLYGKKLPPTVPIGESWEISDRPDDESVIANGPLAGKSLHWLMQQHERELLGDAKPTKEGRFPLLCKILDAREKLSLQVHPPAAKAAELKGEPKTEMWFITDAEPNADLFVGLKRGVTHAQFEKKVQTGEVAECFHRIPVHANDSMFLPSGRVHAIGAGLVIFEIQQNSDTTYRVFDWNRVGLDGKPRELHVPQSLASIDFNDFEPALVPQGFKPSGQLQTRSLVNDPLFKVEQWKISAGGSVMLPLRWMQIIAVVDGHLRVASGTMELDLSPGSFCLIPAECKKTTLSSKKEATWLQVEA